MLQIVVLSPHLDDAVFSLGAAIAGATARGAVVTVLTVLAGDPESAAPAGPWDAAAGFHTAGEAARTRRLEDTRACGEIGAQPVWLGYADEQYERGGSDEEILARVLRETCAGDAVLVPGFPLGHADHRWLAELVRAHLEPRLVAEYVEQPYAALWTPGPADERAWHAIASSPADHAAKVRACRAYATQLPLFEAEIVSAIASYEAEHGGETIAWRDGSWTGSLFPIGREGLNIERS